MRCNNKIYLHMMFYICTILDVENKTREAKCYKTENIRAWGATNAKILEEKGKRGRRACECALTMIIEINLKCFDF